MKKAILTVAVVTTSLLLAIPLIGCQGGVGFTATTASLSEATMAKGIDETTNKPIDKTQVFTPDAPEFFCSAKLSNAPSDTEIKAEWIYVQGEAEGVTDYIIEEVTVTSEGTGYIYFSLTNDALWPRGEYKVVLYVDGKESLSVPFTVE